MASGRGRGGALDPEARRRLDGEQQQLRALAAALAGKDDPRRLPVERASAGWALLGMGSHGRDIDERARAQGKPVTYLEGDERAQKVARVVDGRLVDVSDQALEGPALAPEDVPKKQPLTYSAKLQAAFVKALRDKKLGREADEVEALDNQDQAVQERYKTLREKVDQPARKQLFAAAKQETAALMASRLIYAMNAAGEFFVGESVNGVFHHSSFLAGGEVASAGDIKVVGGEIKSISNNSGHYKPGAAFLWQAVRQLEILGVDLGQVTVEVLNAGDIKADVFLKYFSPLAPVEDRRHLSFDPAVAAAAVKAVIEELRRGVGHE
jgi:hypothetical protein